MVRLKKIPEESREKINSYFKKQISNMEVSINDVLNTELEIESSKPSMATIPDIADMVGGPGLISRLTLNGVEKGEAVIVADVTTVHVMTGIMVLTPADVIKSNIEKGELTETDSENFEELVNNLFDGINQTLATVFSRDFNLEHKETSQANFEHGVESLYNLPKDDYLIVSYKFHPDDFPETTIHLLLPRGTGENLFRTSLEPEIDWGDRTIVVVYDTKQSDRDIIRETLESENIGVADFNSLRDLIRSILREDVDIIIMEAKPNDWDSLMVTRKIRKSARAMNIPVILTLQSPTNKVIYMAYKAGVRDFLVKPLDKNQILEKVLALSA